MKLGWFSDPHIGIERLANTTVESRRRFRRTVFDRTILAILKLKQEGARKIFCNGDLFDTYNNNEETIEQAGNILGNIDGVMAGNHDIKNDITARSTLGMLSVLQGYENRNKIFINHTPNEPGVWTNDISAAIKLVFVPHVLNQELFEKSLVLASHEAKGTEINILCLHCNVGEPGYREVTQEGTALHLTDKLREECEKHFDFILIGHEHPPRRVSDKTRILGNIMPLTFGEMGDRFAYILDTDTKELTEYPIFKKDMEFIVVDAQGLLEADDNRQWLEYLYADVQGVISHTDMPKMTRALQAFWKNNTSLLMVRNGVKSIGAANALKSESAAFIPRTLPELVGEAVEQTPHAEAYREATQAVAEDAATSAARISKGGLTL